MLEGGARDFDIFAGFAGVEAADGDHIAGADGGPREVETDEGGAATGGHGLDGHDGAARIPDGLVDVLDFDLHEEAHAVVDLDVGLDIVVVLVGVDDELGHVGGEAGVHAVVADHFEVIREAIHGALVLVDELLDGRVVQQAERGAELGGLADGGFGLAASGVVIIDIDDGGIHEDELFPGLVFGHVDGLHELGAAVASAEGGHDRVDAILEVDLEEGGRVGGVGMAIANHLIGGGSGVTITENPVGSDDHAGERNTTYGSAGELCIHVVVLQTRRMWKGMGNTGLARMGTMIRRIDGGCKGRMRGATSKAAWLGTAFLARER